MVQQYLELTQKIIFLLEKATVDNLLEIMEECSPLFEQRDKIIQNLSGKPSKEDKVFCENILLPLEKKLEDLLKKNRLITANELRNIQVGKKTHDAYQNLYDQEPVDGIFYDKRK